MKELKPLKRALENGKAKISASLETIRDVAGNHLTAEESAWIDRELGGYEVNYPPSIADRLHKQFFDTQLTEAHCPSVPDYRKMRANLVRLEDFGKVTYPNLSDDPYYAMPRLYFHGIAKLEGQEFMRRKEGWKPSDFTVDKQHRGVRRYFAVESMRGMFDAVRRRAIAIIERLEAPSYCNYRTS